MAANSAVIGLLRVLLSANTAEFETAMRKSADSAKAWSKDLRQIGRQATQVGAALTTTLTLPIAGVGIAAAKLAIDFESSFAGVRKTVDATEPQLAEIAQGFRDLSKTIPVNVNALNRLGETAGALGIPRDKVVEFAAVMAKLGVSTNLTADQAADAIARIQNIFGAAGKDTERLASTLVALGNAGASTEKEIVEMGQRIAGAGHTVGLTQAQVLAFASTLASVGINAEAGGSAISRVFLKINDAVAKGGAGLDEFARVAGMSSAQFKQAFETDAAGATQAFIVGLDRLKSQGENINATIEGLTGKNIILKDTLFRLSGAGALLSDQLKIANEAWQSNTALSKEAGERFKTTESRLILLGNRVKDVGITLGNALGPAIDLAIRGLNTLIPVLEKLAGMFAALPDWVQLGIVAFAGIVAAAGPVLYVFGQLMLSASAIAGAFSKKGIATRVLVGDLDAAGSASASLTSRLGMLAKAASVAGAAFVGWQIGRLVAELFDLDQKIADTITGLDNLTRARKLTAQGDTLAAQADVTSRLTALEEKRRAALIGLNFTQAALLSTQIDALKNDQTRLAIQDSINLAHSRGGTAVRTYAEALAFNTKWAEQQVAANVKGASSTDQSAAATHKHTAATHAHAAATSARTAATQSDTNATHGHTKAGHANIAMTAEQIHMLDLLAKAHTHAAAQLEFETAAWKRWEQTVSTALSKLPKGQLADKGILGLDPSKLYTPKSPFDMEARPDILGPVGLDPSKIDMGAWAKGIPDAQRQNFWKGLFGSPADFGQQLAGTIMGAIQGGGNVVSAAAGMVGSKIGSGIAGSLTKTGGALFGTALGGVLNSVLPAVGSLIGPLVDKLWGSLFGTAGRDTKIDLARKAFGSVEEMQRQMVEQLSKAQYDALWKKFSEVGQNNKDQAIAAVEAITRALDAQKKKQEEVAAAAAASAKAQQEALDEITAKYKTSIDKLENEYKSLSDSVAQEAEEAERGLVETKQRARMKEIEDEKAALEAQRDAEIAAKKETFAATLDEAKDLDSKLRDMFERGYKIPIKFEFPDGLPGTISPKALTSSYDSGARTGWEGRIPSSALTRTTGGGTAQFIADGRVLAEMAVPHIPGVVARLGLAD